VSQGNQPLARIDPSTNAVSPLANPVVGANGFHGLAGDGAVVDLLASSDHPELGVWISAAGAGGGSGVVAVRPDGSAVTANVADGVRMAGVTDRVWIRDHAGLAAISAFTGSRSGAQVAVPDDAFVALDAATAWWVRPGSDRLAWTALPG
jgi:hypothetical protein